MVVTRFVCVSDTHGYSTKDGAFKLPKGDVLIHAGDITTQGTSAELKKSLEWILKAEFEVKIIIAGMLSNNDTLVCVFPQVNRFSVNNPCLSFCN